MIKKLYIAAALLTVIVGAFLFHGKISEVNFRNSQNKTSMSSIDIEKCSCSRIVSLAPNITETLYALGLGGRVVGVTSFCKYPPEAQQKPQVGGYLNLDFEAVVNLKPDIVFILPEQENARKYLGEMKIRSVVLHNRLVGEILTTILTIGKVCGEEKEAERINSDIVNRIEEIKNKTSGKPRPKVLVSIGRALGAGTVKDLYIAGKNTSYDELVTLAGGENVWKRTESTYPVVYREGLIQLNPDIVIDIVTGLGNNKIDKNILLNDWKTVKEIKAVKNGKVFILDNDYDVIPGPRFILFLEDIAKIIHPEADWK